MAVWDDSMSRWDIMGLATKSARSAGSRAIAMKPAPNAVKVESAANQPQEVSVSPLRTLRLCGELVAGSTKASGARYA